MEDKKDIEIVSGDGSNLDISPVYEHLNGSKPKTTEEKPKNIFIPKESKKEKKDEEDSKKEENK